MAGDLQPLVVRGAIASSVGGLGKYCVMNSGKNRRMHGYTVNNARRNILV